MGGLDTGAKIDKINCRILELLQKNCRMSFTDISKDVGLSIDSVKKRIGKMVKDKILFMKVQLRPRNFGFNNIVDVRIKLQNFNEEKIQEFVDHVIGHPNVAEVFAVSGEWNYSLVIIAKDAYDLGNITNGIRNRFDGLIGSWSESITTCAHKFESYDMLRLMGHKEGDII